jgi:hypothetical protein
MTEEDNNLDKVLEYTAKAIQLREDAKQYDKGTLEKYALEATAQVYDEMARKEARK